MTDFKEGDAVVIRRGARSLYDAPAPVGVAQVEKPVYINTTTLADDGVTFFGRGVKVRTSDRRGLVFAEADVSLAGPAEPFTFTAPAGPIWDDLEVGDTVTVRLNSTGETFEVTAVKTYDGFNGPLVLGHEVQWLKNPNGGEYLLTLLDIKKPTKPLPTRNGSVIDVTSLTGTHRYFFIGDHWITLNGILVQDDLGDYDWEQVL